MPRVSKEEACKNALKAQRLKRSKADAGKGLYLRAIEGGMEKWDITVCGSDGKKRVRHLQVPTSATNKEFRTAVEGVRKELKDAEKIVNSCVDFDEYVDLYIRERQLGELTQKTFRTALRGFSLDTEKNKAKVLELREAGLKQSTLRTKLKHVKALFNFIQSKGYSIENPVVGKIVDGQPRTRIPTPAETEMLLRSVDATGDEKDRLYVRLLLATGARSSTMNSVRPCDMDSEYRLQLYNVKMKRRYGLKIPILDEETRRLWAIVIKDRREDEVLFNHYHHDRLIRRMYALFPKNADGETLSPHSLRHAKSTELARERVPVKTAAGILDASVAVMCRHYITVQQEDVDKIFKDLHKKEVENGH